MTASDHLPRPELAETKRRLRQEALARRADLHAALGGTIGDRLADHLATSVDVPARGVVSAYWPMRDEIDVVPAITHLANCGVRVCLPVVVGRGEPLIFRAWSPGDTLVPAGFGTSVPAETAPVLTPDVLLVPLLLWDTAGYRLGYGGGFYDRTLEALRRDGRPTAIGIAYSGQRVDAVPHGPQDQRLDAVLTEQGLRRFNDHGARWTE